MIRISRNETGKAKTHLELNLANNVKDGFFKYINNKMKTKDNVGSLLNVEESLVTEDAKKAKLLKTPFALVFMKNQPSDPGCQDKGMPERRLSLGQRTPKQA